MADRTNWRSIDVTSKAGASPAPGSRLAAWSIAPSITPELYFIDADKHHVCEISYTGTSWVFNDVTSAAGAPSPATGSPLAATEITAAGVPGSDYLPEVYYVDVNNHVCQLAWTGSYWQFNDLTSKAGAAPPATDSPLAATFIGTPQGGPSFMPEVYFIDVNNHVREISWTGSNWLTSDVTSAAGAPLPAPGSPLAATENNDPRATQDIALPEVYYTDTNNHIWQAAWTGSEWQANDVTSAARAPLPASGSPLTPASITTSTGFLPDVYFLDANQHVCQLAWTGTEWLSSDVTSQAGATAAAKGSPLTAWRIAVGLLPEVYFLDEANHVWEISWDGSKWVSYDVTSLAGAPAAAPGSPLAAWWIAPGLLPEVYFVDADNHLCELGWTGVGTQNWMGSVDGSKYLSQLSIPGTHDTLTYKASLAAQDQDVAFDIAAQLNAGIRFFDLRLAAEKTIGGVDELIGWHTELEWNVVFGPNVLTPTQSFLQDNPTECVIYQITAVNPSADFVRLLQQYMSQYDPDWQKNPQLFYIKNFVPTLDQVRGKIVISFATWGDQGTLSSGQLWGLDFQTGTLTVDQSPVTFHSQPIWDDNYSGDFLYNPDGKLNNNSMDKETASIQNCLQGAAANTDPAQWYCTWTNRADGQPTSRAFATGWTDGGIYNILYNGGGPYPDTWEGYNTVAIDQINLVPITQRSDQKTVGLVISDFPNDTSGYIEAIIARNPGLP